MEDKECSFSEIGGASHTAEGRCEEDAGEAREKRHGEGKTQLIGREVCGCVLWHAHVYSVLALSGRKGWSGVAGHICGAILTFFSSRMKLSTRVLT